MKRTYAPSWPRRAFGLTLVEAVAGIAVLGALLTGVLVAASRLRVQDARAARRIEACAIADELLAGWWAKPERLPRSGEGPVRGRKGWRWRTRIVENERAWAIPAEVVLVEILPPLPSDLAASPVEPAARVEIVLPAPGRDPNAPQKRTDAD